MAEFRIADCEVPPADWLQIGCNGAGECRHKAKPFVIGLHCTTRDSVNLPTPLRRHVTATTPGTRDGSAEPFRRGPFSLHLSGVRSGLTGKPWLPIFPVCVVCLFICLSVFRPFTLASKPLPPSIVDGFTIPSYVILSLRPSNNAIITCAPLYVDFRERQPG